MTAVAIASSAASAAAPAYITVEGVGKTYRSKRGDVHALDDVSLEIDESEFVSIVGPSGCGKSTLLMMIAGLYLPSVGRITVGGRAVVAPVTELGIVFQKDVLLDWRSVIDNVLLQPEMRRLPPDSYRQRALALLEQTGLAEFADKYPAELSGGMRQRVSICRALVHDAPLLLMDEPFGALDAMTRDQMNLDLQRIWTGSGFAGTVCAPSRGRDRRQPGGIDPAGRKTAVFITHSISEAVFLSDRVVVMSPRPGKVHAVLPIELPRPRTLAVRETPEFGRYNRELRRHFQALGVLREEA